MENPWKEISKEHPYAKCDETIIYSEKYKNRLQIDYGSLPEPYIGNLKSNILCLNGNPGPNQYNLEILDILLKELQKTLTHNSHHFMWLSKELEATNHWGVNWWKKMTKSLFDELGFSPQLFVLEYFPYHSKKMFNFPKLPSDTYRNYLLKQAMDAGKLIVVMRAESRWYQIKEDGIGKRLKEYQNKIILRNPRRVYLSRNNMGEDNWKKFIETLKQSDKY